MQKIRVEAGYAYGTIGADIHVFGDGTPVYRLFEHQQITGLDTEWLRAQPSRMLDSRATTVDFTGRDEELRELVAWRDAGQRFAARWLHGEGGQGKTRLALQLAAGARDNGWKVVDAVYRTDTHPPADLRQDLRLDGHTGVLLLVDYADRWPVSHLSWLFHNQLLHKDVPTRVLLLARSVDQWPAVRGRLNRLRVNVDTSDQYLAPLPDAGEHRERLFGIACDGFARHYPQISRPEAITPPGPLNDPEFGLTLAVLMAALVAVDAAARGRRAPTGMVGLTTYLLDREHENWEQLYETSGAGSGYRTPPAVMAQLVFLASLVGLSHRSYAEMLVRLVDTNLPADVLLADHAVCYRPTELGREGALQPLLPDRLAEDFLALTLPGSPVTAYPTDRWAAIVCAELLHLLPDSAPRHWSMHAVTFLSAAAARWPHVGTGYLYPMLREHPDVAARAGSAALVALASVEDVDLDMLAVVDDTLEERTDERASFDLAVGAAAICERATRQRLPATSAPDRQMELLGRLGLRMIHAGRQRDAVEPLEEAVEIGRRRMAEADPSVLLHQVRALTRLSQALTDAGVLRIEAFRLATEAAQISRALVDTGLDDHLLTLADCVSVASANAHAVGRRELALEFIDDAVSIYQFIRETSPDSVLPQLAAALNAQGARLRSLGRIRESVQPTTDAFEIRRKLVDADPGVHMADHLRSMVDFGICTAEMGVPDTALSFFEMATELLRKLAAVHPALLPDLAEGLEWLGRQLSHLARMDEALGVTEEAVAIRQSVPVYDPNAQEGLATALHLLALRLDECGRTTEAADTAARAASLRWGLMKTLPEVDYFVPLALDLDLSGRLLRRLERLTAAETELRNAREVVRGLTDEQMIPELPARLAGILDELAGVLSDLGKSHEARPIAAEAEAMRRRPLPPPSPRYQRVFSRPAASGRTDGRQSEAVASRLSLEVAVVILRQLAEKKPDRYLPMLATALHNLGLRHHDDGRSDEAIEALQETCEVFRRLSRNDAFHVPQLALASNNLGKVLYQLDRKQAALAPFEEAAGYYRMLADTDDVYRADLESALNKVGLVCHDLGKPWVG